MFSVGRKTSEATAGDYLNILSNYFGFSIYISVLIVMDVSLSHGACYISILIAIVMDDSWLAYLNFH